MDMGSLLGIILGTILNYKRDSMPTVKGPLIRLIRLIWIMAHIDWKALRRVASMHQNGNSVTL